MMRIAILYVATLVVLMAMDAVFLTQIAGPQFRATLGDLLLTRFRATPAILFYLLYAAGLLVFVSTSHVGWVRLAVFGGLFGLLAYATYDLTNYATLRPWTLKLVLIDLCWGSLVSACSSVAGVWICGLVVRLVKA